jgi:hypothetical protein
MTTKRQFLDPIGAGCRLILLYFADAGTKIRINNHTIELVHTSLSESLIWRKLYGDSRDDLHVLFPLIVRFIELYLIDKKNKIKDNSKEDSKEDINIKCYDALKKLAEYMTYGFSALEKTYGYDNATLTCKFYSNLLKAGINNTYNIDMLPEELKNLTEHNLLDATKIKSMWSDNDIITLSDFFEKCIESYKINNTRAVSGYKAAIIELLNKADEEFRTIVMSTESA